MNYLVNLRVRLVVFASVVKNERKVGHGILHRLVAVGPDASRDLLHVNGPLDDVVIVGIVVLARQLEEYEGQLAALVVPVVLQAVVEQLDLVDHTPTLLYGLQTRGKYLLSLWWFLPQIPALFQNPTEDKYGS